LFSTSLPIHEHIPCSCYCSHWFSAAFPTLIVQPPSGPQGTTHCPNLVSQILCHWMIFFLHGSCFYLEDGRSHSPQNVSAYHTIRYHIIEDGNLHIACLKLVDIPVTR